MIHRADDGLTDHRREMLYWFSRGASQKEIAAHFGVCVGTVKTTKHKIIATMGRDAYLHFVFRNG